MQQVKCEVFKQTSQTASNGIYQMVFVSRCCVFMLCGQNLTGKKGASDSEPQMELLPVSCITKL